MCPDRGNATGPQPAGAPSPNRPVSYSVQRAAQQVVPERRYGCGARCRRSGCEDWKHDQMRSDQAACRHQPHSTPVTSSGSWARCRAIGAALARGARVELRGFGAFSTRARGARLGAIRVPAVRWPCRARSCRTSKPAKSCASDLTFAKDQQIRGHMMASALATPAAFRLNNGHCSEASKSHWYVRRDRSR